MILASLFSALLSLIIVSRCSNKVIKEEEYRQSSQNCPSPDLPPACMYNPLKSCSCPLGYELFVDFDNWFSVCKLNCFSQTNNGICFETNQLIQCTGNTLASNCKFYSQLDSSICSANGQSCGQAMMFNNMIYCVLFNADLTPYPVDPPCPNGYAPTCMVVTKQGCLDLDQNDINILTSIPCTAPTIPCRDPLSCQTI